MPVRLQLSRPLIIWLMIWLAASVACAWAKSVDATAAPYGPTMRVVIVHSVDASCGLNCPEWISAEGAITKDVPAAFHQVFKQLGTRKLPILVHSPGGDIESARRIARDIRRHHFDVVVARTWFENCGAGSTACPPPGEAKGLPFAYSAICASACSLVLAGGEHRYVPTLNRVGVHRPHRVAPPESGRAFRTPLSAAMEARDQRVLREEMTEFFNSMGIANHIVDLSMETPPSDIRWLTRGQLLDLKLVTNLTGGDALIAGLRPKANSSPVRYATQGGTGVGIPRVKVLSKPKRLETASAFHVAVNDVYSLDFIFSHRPVETDVSVTAYVRRFGDLEPGQPYGLRVEFGDAPANSVSISATPTDGPSSPVLRGHLSLSDYCRLAAGEDRLHLTVPSTIGPRETNGAILRLLTASDVWPSCAPGPMAAAQQAPAGLTPSATFSVPPPLPPPPPSGPATTARIDLNDIYGLNLTFRHANAREVLVTAEVLRLGVVQASRPYELLLYVSDRGTFALVPPPPALASVELAGWMTINDYCALARSDVNLRLFVPSDIGRRETTGVTRRILTDADLWSECHAATPESASATH